MPVAVAIQTGGLSTFLAFGMNWGGGRALAGRNPIIRAEEPASARVIDVAPKALEMSALPKLGNQKVLAYSRPTRPGQAPQLVMSTEPSGQFVDITA